MLKSLSSGLLVAALALCAPAIAPAHAAEQSKSQTKSDKPSKDQAKSKKKKEDDDDGDEDDDNPMREVTYSGIGLSRVSTDFDNIDAAVNLNAQLGLRVPTLDWISAEIDFTATIIPGENQGPVTGSGCGGLLQPPCPGSTTSRDDFAMNGIGVFAVLRSPGRFFATGKVGYRYLQSTLEELDEERSGSAWAVGGGWRWGESLSGVELLYSRYSGEVDFLGLALSFGYYTPDE